MLGGELVDLESTFSLIALELFEPCTVDGTLRQIVDLEARTIERCAAGGVVVIDDHGNMTAAGASSPVAATLKRMQIDADEGPCLVASARAMTLNADNLAGEPCDRPAAEASRQSETSSSA